MYLNVLIVVALFAINTLLDYTHLSRINRGRADINTRSLSACAHTINVIRLYIAPSPLAVLSYEMSVGGGPGGGG